MYTLNTLNVSELQCNVDINPYTHVVYTARCSTMIYATGFAKRGLIRTIINI